MTAILYRGMTRTELDKAYSPSSMVPSIEPFLKQYAGTSAAARAAHDPKRWATHRYGPSPEHTLDLFLPAAEPKGLLVFIHGGYWRALNASDVSFPAPKLTQAGFAYAAINYTLAPHATLDAIVEENRQALGWLARHLDRFGLAGRPLIVSGHSAGGHLTAMMLATDWPARGLAPSFISAAILIGGVYDLEPIRLCYVNDPLQLDVPAMLRNSPMQLRLRVDCPLAITWAERDTDEFKRQSLEFARTWADGRREIVTFEQPGVNHFDCLYDWCDPATRLSRETVRLLTR